MTIRVLEIIPTLVRGGAEKQLTLLAKGLPRDQFDVHVAVLTHSGPYEQDLRQAEIPVTLIGKRWKIDPAAYLNLRRYIRDLQPHLVHTWLFAANCYGRQAALAAGVKQIVGGERCVDPWKSWYELAIDRHLAARSQKIVTNSSGVQHFYESHGIAADKFVIIPNGIEESKCGAGLSKEQLAQELNLPSNVHWIGAVGRLWPQKRYKDLIWAAELLRAARDDVFLLIVGEGPQRDKLVRFSQDIGVADHVRFLGERQDVADLLPLLDCFWLGSEYEGQSNALMEAMLAGLPVVATDIPGNRDLIVPAETGFLIPVGDAAEIARKTLLILDDAARAERFGMAARARMRAEFSVERMLEGHAALYHELMH